MHQGIAFMLADMATEIDAARLLVWRAAWLSKQRRPTRTPRARCPSSRPAAPRCGSPSGPSRSWAATATSREYPVERWHRDAKIFDIFEGTEQIQQLVIARAITGLRVE